MNARFFKSLVSIRKYFNCLQSCYKVERVPAKPLRWPCRPQRTPRSNHAPADAPQKIISQKYPRCGVKSTASDMFLDSLDSPTMSAPCAEESVC